MGQITTESLREAVTASRSIGELLAQRAERRPNDPLVRFEGFDLSRAEVELASNGVANALRALGVGRGDRVALMMSNCPEWVALWFGVAKLGAVSVTINTAHKGEGLAYLIRDSAARVIVVGAEFAPALAALEDDLDLPPVFVSGTVEREAPQGWRDLKLLLDGDPGTPPKVDLGPRDPCSILYTSGTTGPPKGCLLPHGQYLAAAHLHAANCDFGPETTIYCCMPLFHIAAQNYALLSMLAAGGTFALDRKFSASGFWRRMDETGANAFNFVGAMTVLLWNQPHDPRERVDRTRTGFGAPMPAEIWGAWEERFNVKILQAFGMTENALPVLIPADLAPVPEAKRGTAGRESPSSEVRIVDEDDFPVPAGTTGEILTRPKLPWTMMTEYVDRHDATQEAFRNCWFHTGDLAYVDTDGYLFYVDRKKDALRRRGEMVSSWEIESLVGKYPGVKECAVVGVPSDVTEDDILIAVVCEGDPIDPGKLIAYCEERTAKFQVPRYVRVVPELPRTQTERVEKYRIRSEGVTSDTWDALAAAVPGSS